MKLLKRLLLLTVLLSVVSMVVAVFMMIEDQPSIPSSMALSSNDLAQAEVFIKNSDPRELEPGEITAFSVNERDLELVMEYGLSQLEGGGASVSLSKGLADVSLSIGLPDNPLGDYLNIELSVMQWGAELKIDRLKIGTLSIPGSLADRVLQFTHTRLQEVPEYVAVLDAINGYSISSNQVNVLYQWQPDLVKQLSSRGRDLLISEEDQQRLLSHASNLASITNNPRLAQQSSLAEVLGPAMLFAKVRGGDPIEENRAAIAALSMYILGIDVARVLGLPKDSVPVMGKRLLLLSDRQDFAQHFLVSAGLGVTSGTGIADTIGLLKELEDSQGGSGFSFTDIGADRTGVRFAELAVANTASARAVQDKFSFGLPESDFMAEFRDLPEFMDDSTFRRIYGGVGAPAYNAVIEDIENRISSTRFFSELSR